MVYHNINSRYKVESITLHYFTCNTYHNKSKSCNRFRLGEDVNLIKSFPAPRNNILNDKNVTMKSTLYVSHLSCHVEFYCIA
ncbi:hypothetical protein Hanom_Chr06g00541711 [Helianthus anomalus]